MTSSVPRLLVVDDDEMNRDVLSRQLVRRGYQVDVAHDGLHALERCSGTRYDLILLDIMMPRMNGIEVVRQLRDEHPRSDLPILMVTAKSDSADVVEALSLGANDYIVKPFSFAVVAARVEAALSVSAEARRQSSGLFDGTRPRHALRAARACPLCSTALLEDPTHCTDCKSARPSGGWPPPSPVDSHHYGRVIGRRYLLERFITQGSSGEVFRCRDLDLGRIFAAKVIDVSKNRDIDEEGLRERIRVEVQAMVRIRNPHVVKIYEVLRLAPKVYALIMDYVRGDSLGSILASGKTYEPGAALSLVRQVAQGLLEAHKHAMIHRDVKPDNIMIEHLAAGDAFAQLLDFGIVSRLGDVVTEHFYGTPLYASPEQSLYHRSVDHRADIYSLGAVLYHMVSGKPPFDGDSVEEVLAQHAGAPLPPMPQAGRSEAFDRLVAGMLAKRPEQRFQTMREVIGHIDEVLPQLRGEAALPELDDFLGLTAEPGSEPAHRPIPTMPLPPSRRPAPHPRAVSHCRLRYPMRAVTETLVTGDGHALVVEQDGDSCQVTALDFDKEAISRWLSLESVHVRAVSLSPCGNFFGVAEEEGPAVRVFGTVSRHPMRAFGWEMPGVTAMALSREARIVAVGTETGALAITDTWGENRSFLLGELASSVSALSFSPTRELLAVGLDDCSLHMLAIPSGQVVASAPPLAAPPVQIAFAHDGQRASVLTSAGHVSTMSLAPLEAVDQCRLTGLTSIRYQASGTVVGLVACEGDWELVDCASA